jgi:uncharacterized protein
MTTYVLDASSILRFTDKETGFERVRELFLQAAQGKVELLLSAINWGEIVGVLCKRGGERSARINVERLAANLSALPLTIIATDKSLAERAANFKYDFKVPFADAFAGSVAMQENATLVTADYDFKTVLPGTLKIEFLPAKERRLDQQDSASRGTLLRKQRRDAAVERSQPSLLVNGKTEQVSVGNLLVAQQTPSKRRESFVDSNIFRPKAMRRMLQAAAQHLQRVPRRNRAPRKRRIRHNPHKASLRHGASRPPLAGVLREPPLRPLMSLVRRP